MKKYVIPFIALAILVTASGFAGATHVSAGYVSRDGDINFTLGGRYDLGKGSSVEGAYTVLPGGYDVAARYKLALYRSTVTAGPVFEGRLMGDHVYTGQAIAAGLDHADAGARQAGLDQHAAGGVAGGDQQGGGVEL